MPNHIVELDDNMSSKICMIWSTCGGDKYNKHDSMAELDTHANMAVVGSQAAVFHTGRTTEGRAFSDEMDNIESMPIVDAALAYDCPKTLKTYLLILKNALHIPSIQHNLILLFIMIGDGLEVNDVPRIQNLDEVIRELHSIMLPQIDLMMPLCISGVFSYFNHNILRIRRLRTVKLWIWSLLLLILMCGICASIHMLNKKITSSISGDNLSIFLNLNDVILLMISITSITLFLECGV